MAEEKKNSTLAQEKSELDKKVADNKNARDEEILSEDELNAVAGSGCGKAAKWQQEQD